MKRIFFVKPNLSIPDKITIVGSSKSILKKRSRKEIDNSKFIVRFNFPETKGFEKYTGTQTSLMVINNINYSRLKFDKILQKPCKFLVISPNKEKKYISNLDIFFFEKKIYQYLLALRFIKHPVIFLNLIKILSSKNFSVGFCFILLCISSGIKINIYGFDLEEDMLKRKHYYKKQKIGNVHNLVSEHHLLKKLKHHELINFN